MKSGDPVPSAPATPELYTIERWFDTGHLNESGARTHTELLADEWLAVARAGGG